MEESKKFAASPATYTSHPLQTGFTVTSENRGTSATVRMLTVDKSSNVPVSSVGFSTSFPPGLVSTPNSTASRPQLPAHDVKPPTASSGFPVSQLGRDSSLALPRAQNGTYASSVPVQGNTSVIHPMVNAQPYSSASSHKSGPDLKYQNHSPANALGTTDISMSRLTPQAARDQTFRPFIAQGVTGNIAGQQPSQEINFGQAASLSNNHIEIAKIVQKLLLPHPPDRPMWTPPSRDYMNKALTCQSCQVTINEVDTVLICDACEKGFHLKCIQSATLRVIPRAEWHCPRCLSISNGKPLPPKYGRVMRSNPPLKVPSTTEVRSTTEKKEGAMDPSGGQQKITADGESGMQNLAQSGLGNNFVKSVTDPSTANPREMHGNNFQSNVKDTDEKPISGALQNNQTSSIVSTVGCPPVGLSTEAPAQYLRNSDLATTAGQASQPKLEPLSESADTPAGRHMGPVGGCPPIGLSTEIPAQDVINSDLATPEHLPHERTLGPLLNSTDTMDMSNNSQANPEKVGSTTLPSKLEFPLDGSHDSQSVVDDSQKSDIKENDASSSKTEVKQDERELVEANIAGVLETDGAEQDDRNVMKTNSAPSSKIDGVDRVLSGLSSEVLHGVKWNGGGIQVFEGKTFYESCSVDGVIYKLQDYAIFHSNHGKLMPFKLQSMWEDSKTGSKCALVNRCYFPGDLPEEVGRPCSPESNEVYESKQESTVMAGLIRGPCIVLPAAKFKEESERRCQLGCETSSEPCPIFQCKWFYDEYERNFQPVPT